jgi:hypothetical protein
MKKTMMVLTGALVLAFFANCGKNDDGPKGGAAEMSSACYQMAKYQTQSAYGTQVQPYGGSCAFPYSSAINSGMTNASSVNQFSYTMGYSYAGASMCSTGQAQAYSPSKGMACVQTSQITASGQPVIYDLSPVTGNFATTSQPIPNFAYYAQSQSQYGYGQSYYGQTSNPYGTTAGLSTSYLPTTATQVYRVCDGVESCPSGQSCRSALGPYVAGNAVGICYF